MKIYEFRQNNSGGTYVGAKFIYIAAENCDAANEFASEYTEIYFDGCYLGWDCNCCGDRWYPAYENDFTSPEAVRLVKSITPEKRTEKREEKYIEIYVGEFYAEIYHDGKFWSNSNNLPMIGE